MGQRKKGERAVVIKAAVRLRMAANIVETLLKAYAKDDDESKQAKSLVSDFRASAEQLETHFDIDKVEEPKPLNPPEPTQLEKAMVNLKQHTPGNPA